MYGVQSKLVKSMPAKKFKVFVEMQATLKLANHAEFLSRVNNGAARRLFLEYEKALVFLRETPEGCPIYISEIQTNSELRYKMFGGRYRIVFAIDGQLVYVYDIQDCRQNFDKNFV